MFFLLSRILDRQEYRQGLCVIHNTHVTHPAKAVTQCFVELMLPGFKRHDVVLVDHQLFCSFVSIDTVTQNHSAHCLPILSAF